MAVVQYLGFEMSRNSVSDEKHLLRTRLRQTAAVSDEKAINTTLGEGFLIPCVPQLFSFSG